MRYRILSDGQDYIIQGCTCFIFWYTLTKCIHGGMNPCFAPVRFKTEKEAEKRASLLFGVSRIRVRQYRIV